MPDPFDPPMRLPPPSHARDNERQGGGNLRTWLLWLALIAVCALIFAMRSAEKAPSTVLPDPAATASPLLTFYARYALGVERWSRAGGGSGSGAQATLLQQIDDVARGPIERLRALTVVGDIGGAKDALLRLDALDAQIAASTIRAPSASAAPGGPAGGSAGVGSGGGPAGATSASAPAAPDPIVFADAAAQQAMAADLAALRQIYTQESAAGLDASARDALVARHGWFAQLALTQGAPASDPARNDIARSASRTLFGAMGVLVIVLMAGASGTVLFVVACVLAGSGRLTSAMARGSSGVGGMRGPPSLSPIPPGAAPSAMIETIVLFLLGFLVVTVIAGAVLAATGVDVMFGLVWGMALLAAWPLARGWSPGAWRRAVGWHAGRGVLREIAAGLVGYLACMPILALGVIITLIIIARSGADASHPITSDVGGQGVWGIVGLFLLAAVWAPLVEETVFRGAFYRHLRGGAGVAASALVCGLVFAIIHPQGFAGVPVLGAMGASFCLLREWRGSIIAPVTAHALNNTFAISAMLLLMG